MNMRPPTVCPVRTRLVALAAVAFTIVGCSGDVATETTTASEASPTSISSDTPTSTESPSTTIAGPQTTVTISDRPLAPEFTLELGEGGEYTLSEGEKPVYLVFWAEW